MLGSPHDALPHSLVTDALDPILMQREMGGVDYPCGSAAWLFAACACDRLLSSKSFLPQDAVMT